MPANTRRDARLNVRLAPELKDVIERAAAALGQTVSDFAVSTLVQSARDVIQQQDITNLSNRDRDRFLALLDDKETGPNKALRQAAARYKKDLGKTLHVE